MKKHTFTRATRSDCLLRLGDIIKDAGELALQLQPGIIEASKRGRTEEKGGNRFASALTDADLIIQSFVAAAIAVTFDNVRFLGEEGEKDLISRYLNRTGETIITLDPVNSTLYYRDGLPHFEVVATACDEELRPFGTVLSLPAHNGLLITWEYDYSAHALDPRLPHPFVLPGQNVAKEILLGEEFADRADAVRRLGLSPIFPWRDYDGTPDWPHASSGFLLGRHAGCVNRNCQLIDGGAFAYALSCMGGTYLHGPFHPETLRYDWLIAARDTTLANQLKEALGLS